MKGIVFTELQDLVDSLFGDDMWDDVLDACDLESGGAYTAVATYDHQELLQIVSELSKRSDIPVKDLVKKYGHHLFGRFYALMPHFFENPQNSFEFLESVHNYIHVEVKKLYPDASLPSFATERKGGEVLIMTYNSTCPFADFAAGLINGCIDHYGEDVDISYVDHNSPGEYNRVFTLVKNG